MKPTTRSSTSAADDENPAPISANDIRVIIREEIASAIADVLGPRLLRVEQQLAQLVSLTDNVTELEKAVQYSADMQQEITQTTLPALATHIENVATTLTLRTIDMELHRRKWSLIVQGVQGPPNEDESATRKAMIDFATNCLLIENAGQLQFVACHRLSNKADAATLIIFVDLAERNRWLHHANNLKNQKRKFSVNPDLPPLVRDLKGELLKMKQELPAAVKAKASIRYLRQWPYVELRMPDRPSLKPLTPATSITQRLFGFDPHFKV